MCISNVSLNIYNAMKRLYECHVYTMACTKIPQMIFFKANMQ